MTSATPLVGLIMGSTSDWATLEHAAAKLQELGIPHERRVVSAHRTPELMFEYARTAEARGLRVIIAGAGGAAHLPGMTASLTTLPVLGVPVESATLKGVDSLYSIVQMPGGVPVATFAIGNAGVPAPRPCGSGYKVTPFAAFHSDALYPQVLILLLVCAFGSG